MEQHPHESPRSEEGRRDASSHDAGAFHAPSAHPEPASSNVETPPQGNDPEEAAPSRKRIGPVESHMPPIADPLVPRDPDTAFAATRAQRADGWTAGRKARFLERLAECGVVLDACEAVGMSGRAAYNLRARDPLFAAGWDAADVIARPPLDAEAYSRARNGVVERIYKDGVVIAERHRYDNRLIMSVLARLDARIERAHETGAPFLGLVARWDDYLAALGEGRHDDAEALLAAGEVHSVAGDHELHELRQLPPDVEGVLGEVARQRGHDPHSVWEKEGRWWTDYPPPAGFDGEAKGEYGDDDYCRTLSPQEQASLDATFDRILAEAEAQRDVHFRLPPSGRPGGGPGA